MNFLRKIIYLNEYTGGVCGGNAGFVKLSQKETRLKIEIRLTGNFFMKGEKIYLLEREGNAINKRFAGVIPTDEKQISLSKEVREIGGITGSIAGVILGGGGTVCAGAEDPAVNLEQYVREENITAAEEENAEPETTVEAVKEPEAEQIAEPETAEDGAGEEEEEIIQVEIEEPHDEAFEYEKIFATHPNMYPFEDDEMTACVQISPADFSDFPKQFWTLGSNSFLLQGYYNYRHLILAKTPDKLYLGIPGQYHRRDKYLADMFGFGRFKGIRRKQEKLGDFGYWLMEIEVPRSLVSEDEMCCPDSPQADNRSTVSHVVRHFR